MGHSLSADSLGRSHRGSRNGKSGVVAVKNRVPHTASWAHHPIRAARRGATLRPIVIGRTNMKTLTAVIGSALVATSLLAGAQTPPAGPADAAAHRYVVERTFAPGALDGLNAALKAKVNANNA